MWPSFSNKPNALQKNVRVRRAALMRIVSTSVSVSVRPVRTCGLPQFFPASETPPAEAPPPHRPHRPFQFEKNRVPHRGRRRNDRKKVRSALVFSPTPQKQRRSAQTVAAEARASVGIAATACKTIKTLSVFRSDEVDEQVKTSRNCYKLKCLNS